MWLIIGYVCSLPRSCRICEDAAQTYHDVYQCAGNEVDLWGAGDNPLIPACEEPQFACSKLSGDIKQACESMEEQLYSDDDQARILWLSQMEFGKPYETCVKLEKCEADPNPEEKEYTPCNQVFQSHEAQHNIMDPGFTANCTEECYLCNWLVKEWPLFQEICVPDGTSMPNSVDADREVQKLSGLESLKNLEAAEESHQEEITGFEQAAENEEANAQQETATATDEAPAEEAPAEEASGDAAFVQQFLRQRQNAAMSRRPVPARRSSASGASSDEQLMSAIHRNWESSAPYQARNTMFIEAATKLKLNSMQRAWSKLSTKAIHGVLSSQAKDSNGVVGQVGLEGASREDALEAGPDIGGSDLKADCFAMWRFFVKSRKAKFFASWKHEIGIEVTPADIQRSNLWDANIVCKCLGQCELDAFEHLGLIEQCKYDERDRTMMEYAFQTPS